MAGTWEGIEGTTISKKMSSGGHVRYIAPEHFEDRNVRTTKHSDTYSFAMLMLECFTEEAPFSNIPHDAAVLYARTSKWKFPPQPGRRSPRYDVPDDLWGLMQNCWALDPNQRCAMEHVHNFFLQRA
jgi:serine/threonine protein kinase